eukprot:gene13904-16404_t
MSVSNTHKPKSSTALALPVRLLLGPGPSNLHPRVNQQLSTNMIGYTDPAYYRVMDETMDLCRYLFQTDNHFTIPISGAGTAAMEACVANLIEPGDNVVCMVAGYFSDRIYQMAQRYGANILKVDRKWGQWFTLDDVKDALEKHQPKLLTMVFGETSTGIKQAMAGIGALCHEHGCLLMVDTVAALGGVPFFVDEWQVDACYTGGQKCLSGPPGISPITFSPRATAKIAGRKIPVANWYLDMNLLGGYWCPEYNLADGKVAAQQPMRRYHHTTPANLIYSLRESILLVAEEGLENVWARHRAAAHQLYDGLAEIGLSPLIASGAEKDDAGGRLYSLTTVSVPAGLDAKIVMKHLMDNYNIEIAGGLGEFAGKVWRVGLMGFNANPANVKLLLSALGEAIKTLQ